jgi:hypothetical protein
VDARSPDKQLTADRSNFWKVVDRTKPSKLYLFSENELRDCQDYFLKVHSDPNAPRNELTTAAEQLTLVRSEIDRRHGDAKYRRAQRLAWWAIELAGVSTTCAIGFGIAQFLARQPPRDNWSADRGTPRHANAYAGAHPAAEPDSRGNSRTSVCNRGAD